MSEELEQRPAKRQRFFVEEPASPNRLTSETIDASTPRHHPGLEDPDAERDGDNHVPDTPPYADQPSSNIGASHESPVIAAVEDSKPTDTPLTTLPSSNDITQIRTSETVLSTVQPPISTGFDVDLFTSIIGEQLSAESIDIIQSASSNNVERAVNIYFDGSWRKPTAKKATKTLRQTLSIKSEPGETITPSASTSKGMNVEHRSLLQKQPPARYIGAFGVGGWATRSGLPLLKHGDLVKIERARSQPVAKRGRGGKLFVNHKEDILTRFTTSSGQEVGRLPHETAGWVSTLIDQKICNFEGSCVFIPDRVRVNDTIYIQLRCYFRREAFQRGPFAGSTPDDNRSTGLFEEKESTEEKSLRLRQIALVKLFHEINLQPASINPTTEKHKRDGLLRAAEMAEQYDGVKKEKEKEKGKSNKDANDSSSEDDTPELEEDQLDALYRKAQSFDFNMPEADPPSTFKMNLRKYQRQALYWMLSKEKDKKEARERSMHPLWEEYTWPTKDVDDQDLPVVPDIARFYVNPYSGDLSVDFPAQEQQCLGGILADEMGLGKTIEMLSLVHSHRTEPNGETSNGISSVNDLARVPISSTGMVPAPYTTLVVAPTSLLSQWESEALKASEPGTMRVLMYYGADKAANLRDICCESKYASAPHVIVTSYGVVLSEFRQLAAQPSPMAAAALGGLFSVEFFRIILDEAHIIKNRRSKSARACYELQAMHRWVLTGTPIVNRLEDLFSLVRFLKVEPWSNFSFWKTFITVPFENKEFVRALNVVQSVLEPLVLRRTKTMKTPEGEPLVPLPKRTVTIHEVELSDKEREIYDCIYMRARRTYNENVEAGTLLQSYSTIFAQILRLRQTCCHPILTRNKDIVADEENVAAALDATNEFKDDMDLQELINQFTTTTETAETEDRMVKFTAHALRQIQTESSGECPICCEEPMIDPAVTACWHSACKKCLEDFVRHQVNKGVQPRCFSCRQSIDAQNIFEVIKHPLSHAITPLEQFASSETPPSDTQPAPRISLRRINPLSPSAHTSAKIHALINHLSRIPQNTKSIVFSQFTSFLDLIGPQLSKVGIHHLRLDGSMPQKARAAVLAQFTKDESYTDEIIDTEDEAPTRRGLSISSKPTPTVLLISLRAGGVGLNLTTASNVFLMDPWWSFAIEAQAIDRVHRMGQLRDVSVTRFIVKDSIEGRMLRVQERKMNIAGSLGLRIGGDESEDDKKKDRIAELKLLFE
ncbi:DNA repair protein rad5 [Penicillium macrosclerotiorum]|uniref:DNA repair protein rad5 n=1 Tax=Penicillium macrosclerotiorum TaxID=303699 RepID=UPI00254884CA|nr:DNA repair protein rad5 [Penicillium macrosclerotiorum]KAJ5690159.1 DNA repair protein rad5 [Penicillium macrosclerotiorum]